MDEIALRDLILKILGFIKKYWILWLLSLVLGLLLAFNNYRSQKVMYKSFMVVTTDLRKNKLLEKKELDLPSLFTVLNILSEEVRSGNLNGDLQNTGIKSLKVSVVTDAAFRYQKPEFVRIDVVAEDTAHFRQIQKAVTEYCNMNRYLQYRIDNQRVEKKTFKEELNNTLSEIADFKSGKISNNFIFGDWKGLLTVKSLAKDLEIQEDRIINVVSGLDRNVTKINKSKTKPVALFIIVSIFAFGIALVIELYKYVKNE